MTKKNGINHSMQLSTVNRRKNVVERLVNQLKSGVKDTKAGILKLSDSDVNRINKEISILKTRM